MKGKNNILILKSKAWQFSSDFQVLFNLKWLHMSLVVVILIVGNPFQKTIATCNLRILINIIWLNRHLHSHTYIHNTQIVALIIEISFAWGLGKFTLICRSPNSIASNKMPRVNMVFHYQTTRNTEKCNTNFQQI